MWFEIFAGTMLVINVAISFSVLSPLGTALDRMKAVASRQAALTVDAANLLLNTIRDETNENSWRYSYLAQAISDIAYAVTGEEKYRPLNADNLNEHALDLFAVCDEITGYEGSRWDNPATEEEAKALKIPMPHSQPQSVFDGASFGAASSRRPIFERKEKL